LETIIKKSFELLELLMGQSAAKLKLLTICMNLRRFRDYSERKYTFMVEAEDNL
jgi:hypothetical protein